MFFHGSFNFFQVLFSLDVIFSACFYCAVKCSFVRENTALNCEVLLAQSKIQIRSINICLLYINYHQQYCAVLRKTTTFHVRLKNSRLEAVKKHVNPYSRKTE